MTWVENNYPILWHQPDIHMFNRFFDTNIDIENWYGSHTYTPFMSLSFFIFYFIFKYVLMILLD